MSELDDIKACAANAHKVAKAWNTRSIGPEVDLTDNGYKFQDTLEKDCEIRRDKTLGEVRAEAESLRDREREFRPHAKDCGCISCLRAIIDYQTKEIAGYTQTNAALLVERDALDNALRIILRNLKAGAVTLQWVEQFVQETLNRQRLCVARHIQ